MILTIEIHVL